MNAADVARRRMLARISRDRGKQFEARLDATFELYRKSGFAAVEKTPEPMTPIKDLGQGRFIAHYEKKAQPDYKGTIKGGRSVVFEAKFTASERMEQSRVTEDQTEQLRLHNALGARCFVLAGFSSGKVYRIPWSDWDNMKRLYGRKYVREDELLQYCIARGWNDSIRIFNFERSNNNERNLDV